MSEGNDGVLEFLGVLLPEHDNIRRNIECPVCYEVRITFFKDILKFCDFLLFFLHLMILMISLRLYFSGHIICSECQFRTKNCALCKAEYSPKTRNFVAEGILDLD